MTDRSDNSDWDDIEKAAKNVGATDLLVRVALLEQSTRQVKRELQDINRNINKLVWAVITAVLVGVLNMVIGQKEIGNVKIGIQHQVESLAGSYDSDGSSYVRTVYRAFGRGTLPAKASDRAI